MFFRKKKKEEHGIPIDEVKKMTQSGMSDKDIIKKLKSKGYSYDEIEKAMLQAVKSDISEEPIMRKVEPTVPTFENFYEEPEQQENIFQQPQLPQLEELPEEQPEIVLEDLIEGVIEDKWHKFDENMKKMEENLERMRAEITQFEQKIELAKKEPVTKDLEIRVSEINERIEDLEARVGGLEKAFKQFLPALTHNIESLSKIIHEMKIKQGIIESEQV
ncbi:MAG: hypothetical protein QXD48_00990 [Candidatus Aenigmatarchaeota archaeon]